MRTAILGSLAILIASIGSGQVTIGTMPAVPSSYNGNGPITVVDLTHPASLPGTVTSASVRWSGGCANAFKLKFLRVSSLSIYTVIAERGPFDAAAGTNLVTLSPPVTVSAGDLLAITQVAPPGCGGFYYSNTPQTAWSAMTFSGDIPNSGAMNGSLQRALQINARATSDPNVFEGVIAGVGATAGGFGAFFRTSLQLTNRDGRTATGKLVFHPAGKSGNASDPTYTYSVPPYATLPLPDIMGSIGQTGVGSLDVISTSGSRPLVSARVFNDAGAAGTSGFTEELIAPEAFLHPVDDVYVTMPSDPANFRMNIGIRTFDVGATIEVFVTDANGNTIAPAFTKPAYVANDYEQTSLQQFIGIPPVADGVVRIRVKSGTAVVYASTTDNRTNDSSIKFAQRE